MKAKIIIVIAILAALAAVAVGNAVANLFPSLKDYEAEAAVPEEFDGFKIAVISDLHGARFGKDNASLLEMVEKSAPDMVAITGDLFGKDEEKTLDFVRKTALIAPVCYVTGNHEEAEDDVLSLLSLVEDAGATVLDDRVIKLGRGDGCIYVAGICDSSRAVKSDILGEAEAMTRAKLGALFAGIDGYKVLLSHRPELFAAYSDAGADLVLAGHAHGGLVRLPFVGGLYAPGQGFFPKYDGGIYKRGNTSMVVSRGLGDSVGVRVFNRPELAVVTLRSKKAA